MKSPQFLLTAGLTGVVLSCSLAAGATSATAAPTAPAPGTSTPSASSTDPAPTTVTASATIEGTRAVVTLTGQKGQKLEIRDARGKAIAGTTLTGTTATLTFTATTSKQAYTVHADGTEQPDAAFTLRDDIVTPDDKPTVDDVDKVGTRATVDVTAAPRAIVRVKNTDGDTIGLRLANSQGHASITVPVPADQDTTLKVSQTNGATESDDEEAESLVEISSAEVTYVGLTHAIIRIKAITDGRITVVDDRGNVVWDYPTVYRPQGHRVLVPVEKGGSVTYRVTRSNGRETSKPRFFEVSDTGTALTAPTAEYFGDFSPATLIVRGVPGASIRIVDANGRETGAVTNESGTVPYPSAKPGESLTITQEVGDEISPALEFTIPES